MAGKTAKRSRSTPKFTALLAARQPKQSRRKLVVFSALAGSLTVTALFLQLLSPPPVRAQVHSTVLMGDPIERISSRIDPNAARSWKYIYIHQSKQPYIDSRATADEVTDHFVIGNGVGTGDGDVLLSYRWRSQTPAAPPQGASSMDPDCISIALVGDLDRTPPTSAQMRRLAELVQSLRSKYGIPANRVLVSPGGGSAAAIGKLFPTAEFGRQLQQ